MNKKFLYELKRRSNEKIFIHTDRAPLGETFTFHNTDGMYSYNTADSDGKVLHLKVTTPLIMITEGHYEIDK